MNKQSSIQIAFTAYNRKLLEDVRNSLISLEIYPSRFINGKEIRITKRSELTKFLKQIGFSNPKHLNKAKMWNLAL